MKLLPLNCNNCGAPLEAPANARFLTCGFCDSRLSITQAGASYSTEVLDALSKQTHRLAEDMAAVRREKEIARLDREWEAKRATYMVDGGNGQMSVSSPGWGVLVGACICLGGVMCLRFIMKDGAIALLALLGIPLIIFGIHVVIEAFQDAREFQKAHAHYQRRRRLLMERP